MAAGKSTTNPTTPSSTRLTRLTRQTVLSEGLDLLDDEGFEALTMRRLAERLGVVPMALYRHVANKEDLIAGILDLAVSHVVVPVVDRGWRDGLGDLARAIRQTMLDHPGVVTPVVSQPSLGPNALLLAEYGLAVLRPAGFSDEVAIRATNAVITYTLGFVALEVPRLPQIAVDSGGTLPTLVVDYADLSPELFAHTIEVRPAPGNFVDEAQFTFGLGCLLDGIDRQPHLRRRTSAGAPT